MSWTKDHETGIPLIDRQHRFLFTLANLLVEQAESGARHERVPVLMEQFRRHLTVHFHAEKELYRLRAPDVLWTFMEDQEDFLERFNDLECDFIADGRDPREELLPFLVRWLDRHAAKAVAQWRS